jgi:predicted GIY-YIG superfamily endonuclease
MNQILYNKTMTYGYIYKIPFPNGKKYIGLTTSVEKRKQTHKCSANNGDTKCLYKALRKYDMIETFELIVIDTADNVEELCEKETSYIHFYNSYYVNGYGYNMTYGGEGTNGYVRTEKDKQRASQAQTNYFNKNPDKMASQVAKMNKQRIENPIEWRKEHGEKMNKHYDINTDAGMRARERARNTSIKQFERPGQREKSSEAQKLRFEKSGAKEKSSEIQKERYARPGEIEKISEAAKLRHAQPGAKEKLLDQRGKNRPFDVHNKDGIFIGTFNYQLHAREYLKKEYNKEKIDTYSVLNGIQSSSKGFTFKYK